MKKLFSLILAISIFMSGLVFQVGAKDFSIDEMADVLSKLEVLHGDASKGGSYDYYSLLTRAQFTKLAVAASSYKNMVPVSTNTSPYSDVNRTHWAAGYIKVATGNQLIKGYPDSTFKPEANVLLEEGVTIVLKLLGYENSDFGGEWPNGQMGIAKNIGLLDRITIYQGYEMSRLDAITLLYNALNTKNKSGKYYIETLGYSFVEDVVLIASYQQDENLDANKVTTSNGKYKINSSFNFDLVGKKGDILLKDNEEILGFYSSTVDSKSYVVTTILGTDILVDVNGSSVELDIKDETTAYYNSTTTTYGSLYSKIAVGDVISVVKDDLGRVKYVSASTQKLEGPITVSSTSFLDNLSIDKSNVSIVKSGARVSAANVKMNDILYYSKTLNTVWVYSDKKTGIYDEAKPNQEFPTSIVLSGTEYSIESSQALSKLASNGKFKYGETMTLLLGKDGKIADVVSSSQSSDSLYAYVLNSDMKEFTLNGKTYSSYYINVVTASGDTYEYVTNNDYSNYRSKIVKIEFINSVAKLNLASENIKLSGDFDVSNMKIGSTSFASNIKIIDVKDTDSTRSGEFVKVYLSRLNGVKLSASNILYYHKNSSDEIDELILKDVTGDTYQYGIMVKAAFDSDKQLSISGSYTYNINGKETSTKVNAGFSIKSRTPAKLDISNDLKGAIALNLIEEKISSINETSLMTSEGVKHILSDKVSVFYVNSDYEYMFIPLSDVIQNPNYTLSAYYDKTKENGGRVRVIIAKKI